MNLVSLLILPAVIALRHNTSARLGIAGVSLVILLVALAFSKRATESMDAEHDATEFRGRAGGCRGVGRLTWSRPKKPRTHGVPRGGRS